jgi:hypothetical protein
MRRTRAFFAALALGLVLVLGSAAPLFAQSSGASPAPSGAVSPGATASGAASAAAKPGPPVLGKGNWGKYMAVTMAGITVLTGLALLAGLAIQAPGFRKADAED